MSFWIEIHCDVGAEPHMPAGDCQCVGGSHGVLAANGEIADGLWRARQQAMGAGWAKLPARGWACPACKQTLNERKAAYARKAS